LRGRAREGGNPGYAELQVTSNFSFLRGASHPKELVARAAELGHRAIAIADRNTLAGVVRAHSMAKELGFRLVIGARLVFDDAPSVLCFPRDYPAYARLSTLLTTGKRRAEKGQCRLYRTDLAAHSEGQVLVALPAGTLDDDFIAHLRALQALPGRLYLAAHPLYRGDDAARLRRLGEIADRLGVPLVATNDVHYHTAGRRPLQDVLTCIREGCTIHEAGYRLHPNAERHLKPAAEMAELFRERPDTLARTLEIVDQCRFSIDELKDIYSYPVDPAPEGRTPQQELERLAWEGAARRYPDGVPDKVRRKIVEELELIATLEYAPYFLTVWDIVRYAREEKNILCQGRGSAANSAVCFVLGITEVDPAKHELLFARFISGQRKEPPDIDVDFEHERREEVIQYIYRKHGRDHAALVATVISCQSRSALRDVGKALGLSADSLKILSRAAWSWEREDGDEAEFVREAGLDPSDRTLARALRLAKELIGFPRHLSQHVGGFVMTRAPLYELVPIENAAMEDRTVIEWNKEDLEEAGLLKVDVLALGMLSCLRRGFALLRDHYGQDLTLASVPPEDDKTYAMMQQADTVGVFQIESRAQMSMLPRLKPKEFYDLVIEVAIVRPGPIQGDMVHPYLKRREGREKVSYPSPVLEAILKRTLGVPLFQEQAMQIAIDAADFTPEEADRLRRSMATFRRDGTIGRHHDKFIAGMLRNNYPQEFAERCFNQIKGFADYGFPESHAASFALLVYVSAWMKCHYPAVFAASLLNSQPMGFYAPAQIIRDARDHGVEVRPVDVNESHWDCTLEETFGGAMALRLGFRQIRGFSEKDAGALVKGRGDGYDTLHEAWRRSRLSLSALETLARADAWAGLGLGRRGALWEIKGLSEAKLPLFAAMETASRKGGNRPPGEILDEAAVTLPTLHLSQQVVEDYRHLHFTLRRHPVAFLRDRFPESVRHASLVERADGERVTVTGLVLVRQQPGTAKGVIFLTLEDETGVANAIVWRRVFKEYRRVLLDSRLLSVTGRLQREGLVIHVVAERLVDRSAELRRLSDVDGEFEKAMSRADVVRHPGRDRREVREVMPGGRNFH
jgi:error-prone DNA polymerase